MNDKVVEIVKILIQACNITAAGVRYGFYTDSGKSGHSILTYNYRRITSEVVRGEMHVPVFVYGKHDSIGKVDITVNVVQRHRIAEISVIQRRIFYLNITVYRVVTGVNIVGVITGNGKIKGSYHVAVMEKNSFSRCRAGLGVYTCPRADNVLLFCVPVVFDTQVCLLAVKQYRTSINAGVIGDAHCFYRKRDTI